MIEEAASAGARKHKACAEVGISLRTLQRWTEDGQLKADRRPIAIRPVPVNKLSEHEQMQVLAVCRQPEYESLPPSQIVPRLADEGRYIASESTFNGSPMKSHTLAAKLDDLGITPSFSRPRVSNDNPFSESLFRTMKMLPAVAIAGFQIDRASQGMGTRVCAVVQQLPPAQQDRFCSA